MGAITACRTAALGGHVEQCEYCGTTRIAYNSCRNRHCPKCQGLARAKWLAERQAELLPVPYFHVVFTLPAPVATIAFHNKAAVYAILFRAAAETLIAIAAILTPASASPQYSTPGAELSLITRMSIASCPAAAPRSMARAGSPAAPDSSSRCGFSRD